MYRDYERNDFDRSAYDRNASDRNDGRNAYSRPALRRDLDGAWLGGVCAGIGRYFEVDPNLVRIAATLGLFTLTSTTILAYLIAWVIVPRSWRD